MIIGIPKGRILNSFIEFFKKKKIFIKGLNTRKLLLNTNLKKIRILLIKSEDSLMLMKKKLNYCVIGKDIKEEIFDNNYSFKKVNAFKCRLSLISKNNFFAIKNWYLSNKKKIYTKYTNISKKYLSKNSIIKKMNGSVEAAILLGLSDYIIDIVQTGETISENNLFELENIMDIYPLLLYKKYNKILENIF
ncbi:ATP phosphoribosyltransferase [Candidatus Vidania fulgoroideorum]